MQQAGATGTYTRQQAAGSPTAIGTALTLTAPPTSTGATPATTNTTTTSSEAVAAIPAGTARGTIFALSAATYTTATAATATGGTKGDVLVIRSTVAGVARTPGL